MDANKNEYNFPWTKHTRVGLHWQWSRTPAQTLLNRSVACCKSIHSTSVEHTLNIIMRVWDREKWRGKNTFSLLNNAKVMEMISSMMYIFH